MVNEPQRNFPSWEYVNRLSDRLTPEAGQELLETVDAAVTQHLELKHSLGKFDWPKSVFKPLVDSLDRLAAVRKGRG